MSETESKGSQHQEEQNTRDKNWFPKIDYKQIMKTRNCKLGMFFLALALLALVLSVTVVQARRGARGRNQGDEVKGKNKDCTHKSFRKIDDCTCALKVYRKDLKRYYWTCDSSYAFVPNSIDDHRKIAGFYRVDTLWTDARLNKFGRYCFDGGKGDTVMTYSGRRIKPLSHEKGKDCVIYDVRTDDFLPESCVGMFHPLACIEKGGPNNGPGEYGPWSDWSECPASCQGSQTRTRTCPAECCSGPKDETRMCVEMGSWSPWSPWTECECDPDTAGAERIRTRLCDEMCCKGATEQKKDCPSEMGSWAAWSSWESDGVVTCTRERLCLGGCCMGEMLEEKLCCPEEKGFSVLVPEVNCYKKVDNKAPYYEAWSKCKDINAKLAEPRTQADRAALERVQGTEVMWLGINDEAVEGTFVYSSDGAPLEFDEWSDGQPDDWNNEDCVVFATSNYLLNDQSCDNKYAYTCMLPP